MNIKLKSCKSDAQSMTVTTVDERGREASAFITVRTCGGPFLQHDAAVGSLVSDLLLAIAALDNAPAEVVEVSVVDEPAPPRKGKTLPPKGAA